MAASKPGRQPMDRKLKRKPREPIPFTIEKSSGEGSDSFTFNPPKNAVLTLTLLEDEDTPWIKAQIDWLFSGLTAAEQKVIRKRLSDPKDAFDTDDLEDLIGDLFKVIAGGRPTS